MVLCCFFVCLLLLVVDDSHTRCTRCPPLDCLLRHSSTDSLDYYKLSSAISKNTYLILAKNPDENSSKLLKAKELNIPIFSKDEFETKYPDL